MAFDIEGARKAGYSDDEIAGFLGEQAGFDTAGAISSGYSASEVVGFLAEQVKPRQPTATVGMPFGAVNLIGDTEPAPARGALDRDPVGIRPDFNMRDASAAVNAAERAVQRERDFGTVAPIKGPEPSAASIARGLYTDVVAGGKSARAGISQMTADLTGSEYQAQQARKERGQADLMTAVNTPEFESDTARGIYGGLSSTVRQAPAIAAALVTRNPSVALGGMVAPMVPDEYGKFRARGATPGEALPAAVAMAATEYITEKMPMGLLVDKFGKVGAGKLLAGLLVREVPGEQVATVVQDAIDTAVANPEKTWSSYLAERPGAAYQTLLATVTQTGLMTGASALASRGKTEPAPAPSAEQMARAKGFLAPAAPKVEAQPATPQAPAAPARKPETISGLPSPTVQTEAVDNIARILGQPDATTKAPDVSNPVAAPTELAGSTGSGSAVDAGSVDAGGLPPVADQGRDLPGAGTPVAGGAEAGSVGNAGAAVPAVATLNDSGTLTVKGDPKPIIEMLRAGGVVSILPATNGVMVGANQAEQALKLVQTYVQNQTQSAVTPQAQAARAEASPPARSDAVFSFDEARGEPAAGIPGNVEAAGLTSTAVDAQATPIQDTSAAPVSEGFSVTPETGIAPISEPAGLTDAQRAVLVDALGADFEAAYQQDVKDAILEKRGMKPAKVERQQNTPLRSFLRTVGIKPSLAADIVGDRSFRANNALPNTIRKDGLELDQLVQRAVEQGFLSAQEVEADPIDAGNRLIEMIQADLRGDKQLPANMTTQEYGRQRDASVSDELESAARAIGFDTKGLDDQQVADALKRIERRRQMAVLRLHKFDAKRDAAIERAAMDLADAVPQEVLDELEALAQDGKEASNHDYIDALLAGLENENESQDRSQEGRQGGGRAAGAVARGPQGSDQAGQGTAEGQAEGLKPLYASRPVTNAADIIAWASAQGFKSTLPADDMHVTVAYSSTPMDGAKVGRTPPNVSIKGGKRAVEPLGDGGAIVLKIESDALQRRWKEYRNAGASWDYEGYTPHVTLTYDGKDVDLSKVKPYDGPVNLGPEKQEALNEDKAEEYVEEPTLTAPTRAEVLAQQDQREAERQRKEDGGDKPAVPRSPTRDQIDLINPQGGIFDAPEGDVPAMARRKQGVDPTTTAAFKAWFKGSKVVDERGKPLRLYHGTTADFTVFDQDRGNIESDFGAGFYFTNTPADVESNYAGIGPDLEQKIQLEAERIASETDREYDDPEVMAEAREKWVQHEGATMPVYLSLKNPAVLGGKKETILTMEQETDEDGDFIGEPTGTLADFTDALRQVASRYDDGEVDSAIETIMGDSGYDQITLADALEILKGDEQFGYYTDENGRLASHEIIRQALQRAGFDGIIDRTVDKKFGSQRRIGQSMKGMHEGTVHYIAFEPEQIKSATGNRGTFDPNSRDITFKRGPDTPRGMPTGNLREALNDSLARLSVPYQIHDSVEEARFATKLDIPAGAKGMYFKGKMHLFAGSIRNVLEGEMVLWHEANHAGLDEVYGRGSKEYEQALRTVQAVNKNVRKRAERWMEQFGESEYEARIEAGATPERAMLRTKLQAIDEALSDMAGENANIGGLKRFIAKVQEIMRDLGLNELAAWIEQQTDATALAMILTARNAVTGKVKPAPQGEMQPAFSEQEAALARGEGEPRTVQVDGKRYPAENANGQPVHPTFAGQQAFWRWAGDNAVMEDGKPIVLYHGTPNGEIDQFKNERGAIWFTDSAKMAEGYTLQRGMWRTRTDGAAIYPVYLSMKNPLVIDALGKRNDNIPVPWQQWKPKVFGNLPANAVSVQAAMEYAKAHGHDGLIVKNVVDTAHITDKDKSNVYAVFEPTQVKSAIGNRGTFSPDSDSISFARGTQGQPAQAPTVAEGFTRSGRRTVSKLAADLIPGLGLDQTGRVQLEVGAKIKDFLAEKTAPWWERLGMKGASPELRRQLRAMKLTVAKAQETAVAVAKESQKLSADEREMVSDIIEQEVSTGVLPPAHAVRLAQVISATMETQTDELVRLGMLTKDSADKWRGKYLPRYYKSKLLPGIPDAWSDALQGLRGKTSAMKGIKGKHLKGRGLYETIPESQLADYEALGWEVRDDGYNPSIDGDGTVQVWRDFTRDERDRMGEIRDVGFRFVMGYMQTQKDIALGQMFEGMALDPDLSSRIAQEGMDVQVPDTSVPGTGAKRYGKLAGRYVAKATMDHLSQIEEAQSDVFRLYREALGIWKEGKTVLNPVSHMNNVVSNLTMAHLAGVSYHRGDKYLAAVLDFAKNSPKLQQAKEAGLFLGTVSDVEMMNTLPKELRDLAVKQESYGRKAGRTAFNVMSFYLRRPMGWAYQNEDLFFRYLIWKDATERGMDSEDAVDYSQKFIFTYDDLPKTARKIRDFGIPFFSYTYKAIPTLLSTAMTHPWRIAAPAAALWAAQAAMYAMLAGDDDDDWFEEIQRYLTDPAFRAKADAQRAAEQKTLPPWMQGKTALGTPRALRLGEDKDLKLPLFIDVSRMIPGGDIFDVSPNAGGVPMFQWLTPSHPLFTTAVAMFGNKDMYFGKDIVDSNDDRGEATEKRLAWLWKQASPAIAVNNYHWERTMNALAQANGGQLPEWVPDLIGGDSTGVGRDRLPVQPGLAALQTAGIKIRPQDLDKSADMAEGQKRRLLRDINREMSVLRRLNRDGVMSDRSFEKEAERADVKRDRLRDGKTVDGD